MLSKRVPTPKEVVQVRRLEARLHQAPDRLVIECAKCRRHGEYLRDRAIEAHGDISQRDFLFKIVSAECALLRHPTAPTRCGAAISQAPSRRGEPNSPQPIEWGMSRSSPWRP